MVCFCSCFFFLNTAIKKLLFFPKNKKYFVQMRSSNFVLKWSKRNTALRYVGQELTRFCLNNEISSSFSWQCCCSLSFFSLWQSSFSSWTSFCQIWQHCVKSLSNLRSYLSLISHLNFKYTLTSSCESKWQW